MPIFFSKRIKNPIIINAHEKAVTIETERLILKSLNQMPYVSLEKDYLSLFTNPENTAYYSFGKPWSIHQVNQFLTKELDRKSKGELYGVFAVYEKNTNAFVGNLGVEFHSHEFAHLGKGHANVAELSYILMKKFWGQGYGTELSIIGKKYAKFLNTASEDQSQEIVATVHPLNIASKKILEKTLKRNEEKEIYKFGGNPRIFFYKPVKKVASEKKITEEKIYSCV